MSWEAFEALNDPSHPLNDPDHPLRNPAKDPGEDVPGAPGVPEPMRGKANWDWGELYYGHTYPTKVTLHNECEASETVGLFSTDLPYVQDLPEKITVPAGASLEVPFRIVTPPEPSPPTPPPGGYPLGSGWGWVDPPPAPQPAPPVGTPWHQPNFVPIEGRIVAWHPWTPDPECKPMREVYEATGHIHFNPPAPDRGPSSLAEPDACEVWWLLGERPRQAEGGRRPDGGCLARIRWLAAEWIDRVVGPHANADPEVWSWLPGPETIQTLTIDELLTMKKRGDALLQGEEAA